MYSTTALLIMGLEEVELEYRRLKVILLILCPIASQLYIDDIQQQIHLQ